MNQFLKNINKTLRDEFTKQEILTYWIMFGVLVCFSIVLAILDI